MIKHYLVHVIAIKIDDQDSLFAELTVGYLLTLNDR